MAEPTLYKWKRILKKRAIDRLYEVAQYEFPEQHLEAIEEIKVARQEMWKQYEAAIKPLEKATILEKIINTRPLLSQYYDSTKDVIEKPVTEENPTIPQTVEPTPEWS